MCVSGLGLFEFFNTGANAADLFLVFGFGILSRLELCRRVVVPIAATLLHRSHCPWLRYSGFGFDKDFEFRTSGSGLRVSGLRIGDRGLRVKQHEGLRLVTACLM